MKNKLLVLIVGIPGTGKTTLANALSSRMSGVPCINTDVIKAAYEDEAPEVLTKSSHTAWKLFGECTEENIIKGYRLLAQELFRFSLTVAEKLFETYNTVIIEGLGIDLEKIPAENYGVVIFYLTNKMRSDGYKNKIRYRNDKNNNWEKNKDVLKVVENYLVEKLRTLDNVYEVEVTDAALDDVMKMLESHESSAFTRSIPANPASDKMQV